MAPACQSMPVSVVHHISIKRTKLRKPRTKIFPVWHTVLNQVIKRIHPFAENFDIKHKDHLFSFSCFLFSSFWLGVIRNLDHAPITWYRFGAISVGRHSCQVRPPFSRREDRNNHSYPMPSDILAKLSGYKMPADRRSAPQLSSNSHTV